MKTTSKIKILLRRDLRIKRRMSSRPHRFTCPRRLSDSAQKIRFCVPAGCPQPIPTPRFSSPNSPLPPKKLKQLMECIEETNELLRTLGNPRNPNNLTGLRLRFRQIRGQLMQVDVDCGAQQETRTGYLKESGQDFLILNAKGQDTFIPYSRLIKIVRANPETERGSRSRIKELLHIDPCLRRDIVLRFGEVVSGDLFLINLFFGIPLHLQLVDFLQKEVRVRTNRRKREIQGILADSQERFIRIGTDDGDLQIDLNTICYLLIDNETS